MLKRPSKQDYVSAEHYASALQIYIDVKESALQSQISLLERSCATLTKERDYARSMAFEWREEALEAARNHSEQIHTDEALAKAVERFKFEWEDKTDE